ncbi:MAG: ABC transporter ATP-binding protein [Candidatus Methanomethylophilaceae archaeon]|nr:ABC transporter ATP-binding protein [Candidatus Methanomethylophilaceae archaeon]
MNLRIENLSFYYRSKPVIEGIDFEIEEGEVIGILGPNGCGKTTLLRNLNKNLNPKSGCVMLDGTDLKDMEKKEIARIISSIPQSNEIKFAFSVREIVAMGRMPFQEFLQGESKKDMEIVEDAMEKTGITHMADRYVSTMSGGERQKVIIARALAQTPKILLMDEPTLHLDISAQFDILNMVHKLSREEGLTVVIVSHDLPMAARYCDRIVMIHDHNIHAIGKTEDVLTQENMKVVFGVKADTVRDPDTGKIFVRLFDSCTSSEKRT